MKRIRAAVAILLVLALCLSGCSSTKTVTLTGFGTMDIPSSWKYSEEDGIAYFMNDDTVEMVGYSDYAYDVLSDKYHDSFTYLETLSEVALSNSVIFGQDRCSYQDEEIEMYYFLLNGETQYYVYVWDLSLTNEEVQTIALSAAAATSSDE